MLVIVYIKKGMLARGNGKNLPLDNLPGADLEVKRLAAIVAYIEREKKGIASVHILCPIGEYQQR